MKTLAIIFGLIAFGAQTSDAYADCEKAEGRKPLTKRVNCLSEKVGRHTENINKLNNREEWGVACVNAVCVGVHNSGVVIGFNKDPFVRVYRRELGVTQSPLNVECHLKFQDEICTVVDGAGKVWFGYLRDANSWRLMDGVLDKNWTP